MRIILFAIALFLSANASAMEDKFSGYYVGIHGGYSKSSYDTVITGFDQVFGSGGAMYGVQFGYNIALSRNWLVGYELDISGTTLNDQRLIFGTATFETHILGSARVRLGYTSDRFFTYATGGLGWSVNRMTIPTWVTFDAPMVGFVIGVGTEYALDNNWSMRLEYLHYDFSTATNVGGYTTADNMVFRTVRAGLNYRFGNTPDRQVAGQQNMSKSASEYWSGLYLGASANYVAGDLRTYASGVANTPVEVRGQAASLYIGHNTAFRGRWIFSVETEAALAQVDQNEGSLAVVRSMGSARARVGYAFDRMLVYALAGGAWAFADYDSAPLFHTRGFHFGWVAGAGFEYALTQSLSGRIEYSFWDLGRLRHQFPPLSSSGDWQFGVLKVGLSYHFGRD